jgi:hypothetical protein
MRFFLSMANVERQESALAAGFVARTSVADSEQAGKRQTDAETTKRHAISREFFRFMFAGFMFSPFLLALGAKSIRPPPGGPGSMSGAAHSYGKSRAAAMKGP